MYSLFKAYQWMVNLYVDIHNKRYIYTYWYNVSLHKVTVFNYFLYLFILTVENMFPERLCSVMFYSIEYSFHRVE